MLSTILIPLDGSRLAAQVLPYAGRLARAAGARLVLLRVAPPLGWGRHPHPEREALAELHLVAGKLTAEGLAVETAIYHGHAEEVGRAIIEAGREQRADLIAMSSHGRGGLGPWICGSVAQQVLRQAGVPVLLVPAASEHAWPDDRPLHILVPFDGSRLAETALGPAREIADTLGGHLVLLRVSDPPHEATAFGPESGVAEARAYLDTVARSVWRAVPPEVHVAVGSPASTIAKFVSEQRVDLVAMATHGRSGLARLVMGSVATGTLQRLAVPLLLIRPAAMRQLSTAATSTPEQAPERGPSGAAISVGFSVREVDLLVHALGGLLYAVDGEWQSAETARSLLGRLEQTEAASREATADAPVGGP
jgi:nucleotide-binding universal stress UspA family protein